MKLGTYVIGLKGEHYIPIIGLVFFEMQSSYLIFSRTSSSSAIVANVTQVKSSSFDREFTIHGATAACSTSMDSRWAELKPNGWGP